MNSYITSIIAAGLFILIAAVISNAIKFEGGANPKDPGKRKMWFWIMAILNPVLFYVLSAFVLAPNPENDQMVYDDYMASLPIAAGIGFVVYIHFGLCVKQSVQKRQIRKLVLIFNKKSSNESR
jgi:sulfoxide reductase heme-binding subunit YedZ